MATDAYGDLLANSYPHTRRIDGDAPTVPWAVHLAGADRRFRLLAFDFDAKSPRAAAAAAADASRLSRLLDQLDIDHLVCASGPSGGRHVWIGLAEAAEPADVRALAHSAHRLLSSLDRSPLLNPDTGAVRPPGAPHAAGGASERLHGSLQSLITPTVSRAQVAELARRIDRELTPLTGEPAPAEEAAELATDEDGHPVAPLATRALSAATVAALAHTLEAAEDHSAHGFRCLLGLASAGQRLTAALSAAESAPGLEHYRTARSGSGGRTRTPRTARDTADRITRDWRRAVATVTASLSGAPAADDPAFTARAAAVTERLALLQERADAAVGRWSRPGGPSDRRVLDALCLLAAQAITAEVAADHRRLARMTGIGRSTVALALGRLTAEGWIAQVAAGSGRAAACWSLAPADDFHSPQDQGWSQEESRPPHRSPSLSREELAETLTTRLELAAHDVFTLGALGHHAGNVYARLHENPETTSAELAEATGCTQPRTRAALHRMAAHHLAVGSTADTWRAERPDVRAFIAHRYGTSGRLAARAERYRAEAALWDWWCREVEWLSTPKAQKRSRPPAGQDTLTGLAAEAGLAPAYPRRADGSPDHGTARALLSARTREQTSRAAA